LNKVDEYSFILKKKQHNLQTGFREGRAEECSDLISFGGESFDFMTDAAGLQENQ
jgi:hypothetical protein